MVNLAKVAVGLLLAIALALGIYGWMLAKTPQTTASQTQATHSDSKASARSTIPTISRINTLFGNAPVIRTGSPLL